MRDFKRVQTLFDIQGAAWSECLIRFVLCVQSMCESIVAKKSSAVSWLGGMKVSKHFSRILCFLDRIDEKNMASNI